MRHGRNHGRSEPEKVSSQKWCQEANREFGSCHIFCTPLGHGYATFNVERMSGPMLQKKMRHKSFSTTQRCIDLADKMNEATDAVFIPVVGALAASS
jgi:integrase